MLFNPQFFDDTEREQEQTRFNPFTQAIACLFDDTQSTLYTFEEILDHDSLYMGEMRRENPSLVWQRECDEFERQRSRSVPKIPLLINQICDDVAGKYPLICQFGFDLGVVILPSGERILDGGEVVYGIFPRNQNTRTDENVFPLGWAPCTISLPMEKTQGSEFWGMIASGVQLAGIGDPTKETAHGRREATLTEQLTELSPTCFFVNHDVKHCFLNHAINKLLMHAVRCLDPSYIQHIGGVQLSDENTVTRNDDGIIIKNKPRLRIVR